MIEEAHDVRQRQELVDQLTGPFRTMGQISEDPELANAPYWWRGDDDAYASSMSAMNRLPRRRR